MYYNRSRAKVLQRKPTELLDYQSPSNFDATNGAANEWNQNSAGYLNQWTWVTDWYGARQIPTKIDLDLCHQ